MAVGRRADSVCAEWATVQRLMVIHYKDAATGKQRTAIFVERVEGLVNWRKDSPPSPACRYRLEDGYVVQIPDAAWELVEHVVDESGEIPTMFSQEP